MKHSLTSYTYVGNAIVFLDRQLTLSSLTATEHREERGLYMRSHIWAFEITVGLKGKTA